MRTIRKKVKRGIGRILPKPLKIFLLKLAKKIKKPGNNAIPKEELAVFEVLKDKLSVVFDVGAREDLSFYEIKKDCEYHLFEPNKEFASVLREKISKLKDHNIKLNEFGLSDKNEDLPYYENIQSFMDNPSVKGINTGKIFPLKKLDDYVSENGISRIDFLKIDAEGFDYKVVLGGLNIIRSNVSYIQFEYGYGDKVRKFVDLLGDVFDLYMIIDSNLLVAIKEFSGLNYQEPLVPLKEDTIALIDTKLIPNWCGGNILGIKKGLKQEIS